MLDDTTLLSHTATPIPPAACLPTTSAMLEGPIQQARHPMRFCFDSSMHGTLTPIERLSVDIRNIVIKHNISQAAHRDIINVANKGIMQADPGI